MILRGNTLALRNDGTVIGWGKNNHNQLGNLNIETITNRQPEDPFVNLSGLAEYVIYTENDNNVYNKIYKMYAGSNMTVLLENRQKSNHSKMPCVPSENIKTQLFDQFQ